MYKIYINETPLILLNPKESVAKIPGTHKNLVTRYAGKPKSFHQYLDTFEKNPTAFESVTLFHEKYEQMIADFFSIYTLIEAAGGVVLNEKNETLFIFRRGFWDLPKGKIDEGESVEAAAIREIQEETGITQVVLKEKLCDTYHTYTLKGKRILKKTHWFLMQTNEIDLKPQQEEDIEIALWQSIQAFQNENKKVYGSIKEVLSVAQNLGF